MPGKQDRKGYLNIRFSDTARWIIDTLQEQLGLSQASVVEMLLREEARRRGIVIPGSGTDRVRRDHEAETIARHSAMVGPQPKVTKTQDPTPTDDGTNGGDHRD